MANDCYFLLKAVAREKGTLERLYALLDYKDPEGLFLYRVRDLQIDRPPARAGGFWTAEFSGDVAWSDYYWFHDYYTEHDKLMLRSGIPESALHNDPDDEKLRNNIRTFQQLCKEWGFGVESWTEELGCEFQGHKLCTHTGDLIIEEERDYSTDEHGKPEPGYEGFKHKWGVWSPMRIIYGTSEEGVK